MNSGGLSAHFNEHPKTGASPLPAELLSEVWNGMKYLIDTCLSVMEHAHE